MTLTVLLTLSFFTNGRKLRLPSRPLDSLGGSSFARQIEFLTPEAREKLIYQQIVKGNVPEFLRTLVPVSLADGSNMATLYVSPDYLAVGSDQDYIFVPMTPYAAQRIADRLRCALPTPKIVDAIYQAAIVKLTPAPIPPSPAMTTVAVFEQHNRMVADQRAGFAQPLGALVAGDKKDIVICKALPDKPNRVAIYGWHKPDAKPIQPLYLGHFAYWADYSHGVRLIDQNMEVNDKRAKYDRVLADPNLAAVISSEGLLRQTRYRIKNFPQPSPLKTKKSR
jgi:hypothetical protein